MKGFAALGWISFFTITCGTCTGLPLFAGLLGGVAVTTRFGVSAGVVSAVLLTPLVIRRVRARRQRACALPGADPAAER